MPKDKSVKEIVRETVLAGEGIERQGGLYIDKEPKRQATISQASAALSSLLCGELEKLKLIIIKGESLFSEGAKCSHNETINVCISTVKKVFEREGLADEGKLEG